MTFTSWRRMKIKFGSTIFGVAFCAALPALAQVTVTGTAGCTSQVPDLSGTVTYAGDQINDSGGDATFLNPDYGSYQALSSNPGCNTDYLADSNETTTVDFSTPLSYIGFVWGTPDDDNVFDIYDGSTLLDSYTGAIATAEYMNFFADPGEQFTSVTFTNGPCCFETDNLSYAEVSASSAAPEPGTFYAPILAAAGWFLLRCLRLARVEK